MPQELVMLANLDRYGGAINVLGRPLGAGEIRRMNVANAVVSAYVERRRASDYAVWAQNNKDDARLLNEAKRLAEELIDGESQY